MTLWLTARTIKSGMFRCATGYRSNGFASTNRSSTRFLSLKNISNRCSLIHRRVTNPTYIKFVGNVFITPKIIGNMTGGDPH